MQDPLMYSVFYRTLLVHYFTEHFCRYYNGFWLYICLTSDMRVKCGVRSTLCWKIVNISGSTELFGL